MAQPETDPVRAAGLRRRYGPIEALDGVDLTLRRGEFLTLLGPNGAGKTTLLKALASLLRLSSGTLRLFGLDPRIDPEAVRSRTGFIGHTGLVYPGLSATENLKFYARLYDVAQPADRVRSLLAEVGLSPRADDPVRTFSRGMVQRLAIARALVNDPDLVLLDEPYTGLDQHAARMLRRQLDIVHGSGRTVLMVTHNLREGLELGTRVAIMDRGRFLFDEPAAGLTCDALERTYHDVVGRAQA